MLPTSQELRRNPAANSSVCTLRDPEKMTQLSHAQAPDPQKPGAINMCCSKQSCLQWYYNVCSLSCVQLSEILWTVACQAPLSMGFSRQEHWSGLPCPPPGDPPDPGIEPASLISPVLGGELFTTSATWSVVK